MPREALVEEIRGAFERDPIDDPEEYAWILSFPAGVGQRIELSDFPELAFRLAHSAYVITRSDTKMTKTLDWESLGRLYGAEETAVARVGADVRDLRRSRMGEAARALGIPPEAAEETVEMARGSLVRDAAGRRGDATEMRRSRGLAWELMLVGLYRPAGGPDQGAIERHRTTWRGMPSALSTIPRG